MDIPIRTYKRRLDDVTTRIHRFLFSEIDWEQPLIGIKGQRGVGKTTMMLQRIKASDPSGEKSFYASLDNIWFADHSLIDLAEAMLERGVTHLYLEPISQEMLNEKPHILVQILSCSRRSVASYVTETKGKRCPKDVV